MITPCFPGRLVGAPLKRTTEPQEPRFGFRRFPGRLVGAPLKRGPPAPDAGLRGGFPGRLVGAPLKRRLAERLLPRLPRFPGRLVGAPLKPDHVRLSRERQDHVSRPGAGVKDGRPHGSPQVDSGRPDRQYSRRRWGPPEPPRVAGADDSYRHRQERCRSALAMAQTRLATSIQSRSCCVPMTRET